MLRLFNVDQLLTDRVIQSLKRQEQIDDLLDWYEFLNPLPAFKELAAHELKQAVESTALAQMSDAEYAAFRQQWDRIDPAQQRQYLCELAGLPDPERDRGFTE
jgi:hypothetical protein